MTVLAQRRISIFYTRLIFLVGQKHRLFSFQVSLRSIFFPSALSVSVSKFSVAFKILPIIIVCTSQNPSHRTFRYFADNHQNSVDVDVHQLDSSHFLIRTFSDRSFSFGTKPCFTSLIF